MQLVTFCFFRWGFVTHGGVDGFSRMIVYLKCTTKNSAEEVLNSFTSACVEYSMPSRVRSDHGSENLLVGLFMNIMRGNSRGSFITGRSVHNQRIERLWRDVHKEVTHKFYTLFYDMEDSGRLEPTNDIHRFALHKVFLPVINDQLRLFRSAWNRHRIRTANNKTPRQLWIEGTSSSTLLDDGLTQQAMGPLNLHELMLQRLATLGAPNVTTANYQQPSNTYSSVTLTEDQERELDAELRLLTDLALQYDLCVVKLHSFIPRAYIGQAYQ